MCVVRVTPVLGTGTVSLSVASRHLSRSSKISGAISGEQPLVAQTEERLDMQLTYPGVDSDMRADMSWQAGLFH
ncbi:MAG: hypothetical protein KAT79_03270 [candidate division Zixibacteria bacterium]|nr:hypothetical protein [candidate division Zixibacteria bacterium]